MNNSPINKSLNLKTRKLVYISGSVYISLPRSWLEHHQLAHNNSTNKKAVHVSIDSNSNLIIEPVYSAANQVTSNND